MVLTLSSFHSIDLSGVFQGKIQVGLSSTAESDAARKSFLVSATLYNHAYHLVHSSFIIFHPTVVVEKSLDIDCLCLFEEVIISIVSGRSKEECCSVCQPSLSRLLSSEGSLIRITALSQVLANHGIVQSISNY